MARREVFFLELPKKGPG